MVEDHTIAPYRLVGRLKNNRLWEAVVARFPAVQTQSQAARALDESVARFNDLLNMRVWPQRTDGRWSPVAQRISLALGVDEDVLFDPVLYGKPPATVNVPLGVRSLPGITPLLRLSPHQSYEQVEATRDIRAALDTLTPREARIIERRFGLDGKSPATLEDIGMDFAVSRERIRSIEAKALRKLRHPSRSRGLLPHHETLAAHATGRIIDC